jgi:tetratricopeptide (TPR) repeat protein/CheY-like chemotaxis protein
VLEEIRELPAPACDMPVFLLTDGRITPDSMERARVAGATAMLSKPVPLAKLQALVRKHIKESPPRAVEVVEVARSATHLEGELRDLDFASLLHHLHGLRASGALVLRNGRKRKVIQIREGYAVAIKSNLIGECFGNMLVARGVISQEAFEESVDRLKKGEGLQGQILVAMEVMDEAVLSAALIAQAEEKVLEIFEWRRGHYEFRSGARLKGGFALRLEHSPAARILEGVRERVPIARVDRYLRKNAARFVRRAECPFYRLQDVELSDTERGLLEAVDGMQRVGSLAGSTESGRQALYGLLATGLLDQQEEGNERSTTGPADCPDAAVASGASDENRPLRTELAALAERMRRQTYYEVLGVSPGDDAECINTAFEDLARRAHPDQHRGASAAVRALADEVFQRLENARETLRDPRRCRDYEVGLRRDERDAAREKQGGVALEAEVEFQQGEMLLRERRYESALLCFGKALQRVPQEGEYVARYGWCLHLCHPDSSAMVEEAIEHVRRSLKLARDHEKPYLFLGRLYKVIGKPEAAGKMFTRAVQVQPRSVEALRELRLIDLRRRKKGLIGRLLRR